MWLLYPGWIGIYWSVGFCEGRRNWRNYRITLWVGQEPRKTQLTHIFHISGRQVLSNSLLSHLLPFTIWCTNSRHLEALWFTYLCWCIRCHRIGTLKTRTGFLLHLCTIFGLKNKLVEQQCRVKYSFTGRRSKDKPNLMSQDTSTRSQDIRHRTKRHTFNKIPCVTYYIEKVKLTTGHSTLYIKHLLF